MKLRPLFQGIMDTSSSTEGADRLQALAARFREGEKAIFVKGQQLLTEKQFLDEKLAELVDLKRANVGLREDLDEHESRVEATNQQVEDLARVGDAQLQRQKVLFQNLTEAEQKYVEKEFQLLEGVRDFVEEILQRIKTRLTSRQEMRAKLGKDVLLPAHSV